MSKTPCPERRLDSAPAGLANEDLHLVETNGEFGNIQDLPEVVRSA